MKKVLSFALVAMLVLSAASFAQAKKAAPKKSDVSFGFVLGGTLGGMTAVPTVQYNFTKDFSGQAGLVYSSGGGATNTKFLIEGSYTLMKVGANDFTIGGMYWAPASGVSTISLTCGVKADLNSNVELQFLIFPLSITSTAGGSTTTIGGATIGAHLYL